MRNKRGVIFDHRLSNVRNIHRRGSPSNHADLMVKIDFMASSQGPNAGMVPAVPLSNVPTLYTSLNNLAASDAAKTPTHSSRTQNNTVEKVLPYLTGTLDGLRPAFNDHGVPALDRAQHADFARFTMGEDAPTDFVMYDPARPWMVYWATTALGVLGELKGCSLNRTLRDRAIDTFSAQQSPTGGFGGSHGHLAHLAPTYAAVLSLAMLSGQEDGIDAFRLIDRRALWEWLGEIKQADGGFAMCVGGEVDVRGAYCAITVVSILNLPLELPPGSSARNAGFTKFTDGLKEWLQRCQTYEGGISGAPDSEAHGAYAFCALGCLSLLGDPRVTIPEVLDVDSLVAWLSSRQYSPEGGFSGRTNKLVDACYSHWVGGCWPLLEAALSHMKKPDSKDVSTFTQSASTSLYDREGLIRYILCCCQADDGGFRDKPDMFPDGYHTCYTLAGLSSAQHYNSYKYPEDEVSQSLPAPFGWVSAGCSAEQSISEDVMEPVHPVFVIPFDAVKRAQERFKDTAWL